MNKNKQFNLEMEKALENMHEAPEFIAKIKADESELNEEALMMKPKKNNRRSVVWIRNHNYAHKQWRRFLSCHPALDIKSLDGLDCYNAIFCYMDDAINIYNHLFVSSHGDLRILRGKIQTFKKNKGFVTGNPAWVKDTRKHTVRCIRRIPVSEENCNRWNYYKKMHIELYD